MDDLIVAIHQPNLYPWLGYFHKIAKSDTFIFLDDVQIQKTGASYTNRVSIAVAGSPHHITAPIRRRSGVWNINETELLNDRWIEQTTKTLQSTYSKAAHFLQVRDLIFGLVRYAEPRLSNYNINFITRLSHELGLGAAFRCSSELPLAAADPTQRLAALTRSVGGTVYLSGNGAAAYQDEQTFRACDIKMEYIDNSRLQYHQLGRHAFVPGLSILDAIFNLGIEQTSSLLRSNC